MLSVLLAALPMQPVRLQMGQLLPVLAALMV
jgi:hypothetical protein